MPVSLNSNARTDPDQIRAVKETNLNDAEMYGAINQAFHIVDSLLSGTNQGSDRLRHIETNLAAHILSIGKDKQETKAKKGELSASFSLEGGLQLDATTYGQMAKFLDSSGKLADAEPAPTSGGGGGGGKNQVQVFTTKKD